MKNILTAIGDLIHKAVSNPSRELNTHLLRELKADDSITLPQAYAMLLVDMALIDQRFDAQEYEFIFTFLAARFGMSDAEIRELVHQCSALISNHRSTISFAEHMAATLPVAEREEVLAALKGLMNADQKQDGYELYLKKRFRELLGLDQTQAPALEEGQDSLPKKHKL